MPDGSRSITRAEAPIDESLDRVAALYRRHYAFVWRVLRRCGVPESELDDAVQETFIVVHRRIGSFDGRAAETTWLYAVAVRVASTLRRTRRREEARRDKAGRGVHATPDLDPERELSRTEASRILYDLLDELDDKKRTVFVLAELEGVKVPEISRILGVNVRTVHSRLRLARERFGVAAQRHRVREDGRLSRARIRARKLAEQAHDGSPPKGAARASWAVLTARIERGATPILAGWQTIAIAPVAASAPLWGPMLVTVAVGLGGLGIVRVVAGETDERTDPPPQRVTVAEVTGEEPARSMAQADSVALQAVDRARTETPSAATSTRTSTHARTKTDAGGRAVDPRVDPLVEETRLLERARVALRSGDADEALAVLEQHRARHSDGVLANERRATRIKALCKLGRADEAKALIATWTAEEPDTKWHILFERACNGAPG